MRERLAVGESFQPHPASRIPHPEHSAQQSQARPEISKPDFLNQ
jgi:hypothetical protein